MDVLDKRTMINNAILSRRDLEYIMDLLHDSIIEKDNIKYDKAKKVLDLIFYRPYFEDKNKIKKKNFLFIFRIIYYPIARAILHLENIGYFEMFTMNDDLNKFYFNFLKIEGKIFKMLFDPTLEIKFSFENDIKGHFKDEEVIPPYDNKRYKFRAFKFFNFTLWFD